MACGFFGFCFDQLPLHLAHHGGYEPPGALDGLVDECHLFVAPIVVGGGKRSLPDNVRVKLELLDERRFGNGMVYVRYRTGT